MAKSKTSKKDPDNSLGNAASDIFNQDLSVKPGHFPELDDEDYPAKLKEELQKDGQQRKKEEKECPPVTVHRRRLRGFHKYRTAAYIHDQGQLEKENGRDHYTKRPNYAGKTLNGVSPRTCDILSNQKRWEELMAFPRRGSPRKYKRESQRFLLVNINQPKKNLTREELLLEQTPGDCKELEELLERKRDEDLFLTGPHDPYQWQAHHLIPHETLTEKELGEDEYLLLQASGYDVNNGHNGIIAPAVARVQAHDGDSSKSWDAPPMHCVIQHKGNHPEYSADVKMLIADVKSSLKNLAAQSKNADHRHAHAALLQRLTDVEDELWRYFLDLSYEVISKKLLDDVEVDTPHTAFERGESLFPFAVLK